ncbi:MAG: N-6 DNA methylase [Pseudomonadota bacterium]|nr:N-6 DNA methylase [Pseudomonadota bacterium]MDP1904612.1 N-6 DNA methylase [Pseudomonadota bacterium]MDP2353257.1 N-6 DNA methylase [Pseudomonadota bacterium]
MKAQKKNQPKALNSLQSLNSFVKSICDVMRRSNCASALQYVPELTWILFLRILDQHEGMERDAAEMVGRDYTPALAAPFRWRDWAAHHDATQTLDNGLPQGWKRKLLTEGRVGALFDFINGELLPHLRGLSRRPLASPKQKIIGEIMTAVEKVRVDSEANLLDVLDMVGQINSDQIDTTHLFTLSQVYEDLLLRMGEKNSDGGQFFTPREVIRAMARVVDPKLGETVYDPCCGTGGFLAQAYEYMRAALGEGATGTQIDALKHDAFFGREKENLVFPIALANLVLHGIDQPNLWHGNTLTEMEIYGGLFENAPSHFDVILTNPPFGGKEGKTAQDKFPFKTSATQVLFLQHLLKALKVGGRCGIVLDEGVLFRTNEEAFVRSKRKLLDECDLWCVVSLPGGVFTTAGAGVKTNLLFFTKGRPTTNIWYYDLSDVKVGKKTPLGLARFDDFFARLPGREESEHSWTVDFTARLAEARAQAEPHRREEQRLKEKQSRLKETLAQLKKERIANATRIATLNAELTLADKAAREAAAKAQSIEDAAYDIKAVNPNAKADTDARSSADLIEIITTQGREVTAALDRLKSISARP